MKINYNKKNINIISFFVSIILFLIILLILNLFTSKSSPIFYSYQNQEQNSLQVAQNENNNIKDISINEITNWKIEIEKLNLNADIKEGTSKEIIKNNVGHYTASNVFYGIIALKAYNTGENNNYFANLKELQIGDEIKYTVNNLSSTYKVISNKIIDSNNIDDNKEEYSKIYDYIKRENNISKNDILILITYVKDMPNKYRCVIAKKIYSSNLYNKIQKFYTELSKNSKN